MKISLLASVLLLFAAASCRTLVQTPQRVAEAIVPGAKKPEPPPVELLLSDVMRYSDDFVLGISEASRSFSAAIGTREAEIQAVTWSQDIRRTAVQMAAGPSLMPSLIDLLLLATVQRWIHEDHWLKVYGDADRPMLETFQQLEKNGWELAGRYLTSDQLGELHQAFDKWRGENSELSDLSIVEIPKFSALIAKRDGDGGSKSSLLGLVGLDPLSGLEPAAREVALARQLGERLLFSFQRMPRILSGEVELRLLQASVAPETEQVLGDLGRLTKSVESFSLTAASLPEGLARSFGEAEAPLGSTLEKAQGVLAAGERTSAELTGTIRALDTFVGRFEEPPGAEPAAQPAEPSKPFDISEYGDAAARIGAASRDLTALLSELGQRLPEVERTFDAAATRGDETLDRAALRALEIGLALIAAAAVAALLVRRMGGRGALRRAV